jgi:NodT family efflux transporter outer membrane factor (OMF) lipoprotein
MKRQTGSEYAAHRIRGACLARGLALAGLVGLFLGTSGCTTGPLQWVRNGFKVGPNYCRPPAPVAPEWIEAKNPRVVSRHVQYGAWWTVFEDPSLDALVRIGYAQNVNLRVLGTRVLQARAQQAIAVGSILPQTLQATGQYSRVGLSRNMANNPAALNQFLAQIPGSQSVLGTIPPSQIPTSWFSEWSTGFNMSWELDFWGRFRRNIEAANATLDASVENFDDALETLLADVASNYVQFRVAQQRIKIARDNVRIQKGIVAIAARRLRVGTGTRLDVEQARTILEQTRSTIPALQITLGQANDQLCVLLGSPPRDLEPKLGPGTDLGADPMAHTPLWVAAGIPADLLRRRPDVRSAERQIAAQSARIGVAEADLYPAIFINGTLGWEAQDLSKLFESKSFFGTITPTFRWNILNSGRILNNVRLQDARTLELIAAYQSRVLAAGREAQEAASKIGLQQYRAGTIDFNRVFNLQSTQVQVQDQLAVAQGNIALNLINVYRALGGGWEIREQHAHGPAGPSNSESGHEEEPVAPGQEPLPAPRRLP